MLNGNILGRSFGRGFSWKYLEQAPIQFCNVVGQLSPSKSLEVVDKDEKADEDGEEQNATNPFFNQSRVGAFLYRFSVGREGGFIPVARKAPFLAIPFQKFQSNFRTCVAFFKAYTGYEVHEVHKDKKPPGDPFSLPKPPFQTSQYLNL